MLVLTLEPGQSIVLTDEHGRKVVIRRDPDRPDRFGISAPMEVAIARHDAQGNPMTRHIRNFSELRDALRSHAPTEAA